MCPLWCDVAALDGSDEIVAILRRPPGPHRGRFVQRLRRCRKSRNSPFHPGQLAGSCPGGPPRRHRGEPAVGVLILPVPIAVPLPLGPGPRCGRREEAQVTSRRRACLSRVLLPWAWPLMCRLVAPSGRRRTVGRAAAAQDCKHCLPMTMVRHCMSPLSWTGSMTEPPTFDPDGYLGRLVAAAWQRLVSWASPTDDTDERDEDVHRDGEEPRRDQDQ